MSEEGLSKPLRVKIGMLLADFLQECSGESMPGLAHASTALRKGDLNDGYVQVREFLKQNAPLEQIIRAMSGQFGEGAEDVVRELRDGKYSHAVGMLAEMSKKGSIYVCEPVDFARVLCGSYIGSIDNLNQETSGLVTHVAAYGDVPGYERFTHAKPGTIGVYQKGRTTVGTITVHKPGEAGCVSIWAVTLDDHKLGQKDVVDAFGFSSHLGELVSQSTIHVGLRDSGLKEMAGYNIKSEKMKSPGLGAYRLEADR